MNSNQTSSAGKRSGPSAIEKTTCLKGSFKAAMFDVDGTLTEIGKGGIPEDLARKLADLSLRVPLSFATGRSLPQVKQKLAEISQYFSDEDACLKNWHSICENGALGYFYNPEIKNFEPYYHIKWPEEVIDREELKRRLEPKIEGLYHSIDIRETQFLIRITPKEVFAIEVLEKIKKVVAAANETLAEFEGHEIFEVLDSSIAVHISLKDANKDVGIKKFAERLGIADPAREILVVGDQPGPGKNDDALLRGEYGTPYSAGEILEGHDWPKPILDETGSPLHGPAATLHLLQNVNFDLR